jgi:hypothetical protein
LIKQLRTFVQGGVLTIIMNFLTSFLTSIQLVLRALIAPIMSWYIPTSQALGLVAQNKLLKYYLRSSCEAKTSSALNYIIVKRKAAEKRENSVQAWKKKEKVLVLMHGYGLGLGFFYGKSV